MTNIHDFDAYCEAHDIQPGEEPAAFAAFLHEKTGWDGPMGEVVNIHKAEPNTALQKEVGVGYCKVCGQRVKRVPGGQGPTWVHVDTGAVAAPSPSAQDESGGQ